MGRKRKGSFLKSHYEKLVVAVVFLCLAASVAVLFLGKGAETDGPAARYGRRVKALKPAHPSAAEPASESFDAAVAVAKTPFAFADGTFLVAPERVYCADPSCRAPIPLAADVCPYCRAKQPSETVGEDWDSDGDGLPDTWEKKYGFNPLDATDATGDADADGFTNLEEFRAKTDPTDPKSHPSRVEFLRVSKIAATTFPYVLRGKSKLPDGKYKFQLNPLSGVGATLWIRTGDKVADTGFVFDSYEARKQVVKRPGLPDKEQDIFYVRLVKAEDGIELCEDGKPVSSTFSATFVCTKDASPVEYTVGRGESFSFDGETLRLKEIDRRANTAVLVRSSNGQSITISASR